MSEVLAEAGLSSEAWEAAQETWLSKLARDAARGELRRGRRFSELVEEKRVSTARRKRKPPGAEPRATGPVAPSVRLGKLAGRAPEKLVPSALVAALPEIPAPAPPSEHTGTAVFMAPSGPAPDPLPFTRPPSPPVRPPPAAPRKAQQLDQTDTYVPPDVAEREVLPFAGKAPPLPPNRRAGAGRPGLPFQSAARAPLPSPSARGRIEAFTLAQYAKLCARVRADPKRVAELRAELELDAESWTALHGLWQDRFQGDPTLKARWQWLVDQHLGRRS